MADAPTAVPATPNAVGSAFEGMGSHIAILNAIPAHVAVLDHMGMILVVNEAWRRFGTANSLQSEDFLTGHDYLAVCEGATGENADDAAEVAVGIRAVLDGRLSEFDIEYPCHSPTEERWFRLLVAPLQLGEHQGAVAMHVDVTIRRRAEVEAHRLASIVESSEDAIIGKTLDGRVTSWNRGAERMFGYTAAEMIGTSITRLFPVTRLAEEADILDRLRHGDSTEHFETSRVRKDGRPIEASLTVSPMRDSTGAVVGASTVARDISDRKRLERQLLQAQRLEGIGTLAGGIAHDVNNALSPIMLAVDLLRMSPQDASSRELLDAIDSNAQHSADLVRQILTFARGVEGDRIDVNVNRLVSDVERTALGTFPKEIEVRTSVADNVWRVGGDPTQLQQVLVNLCFNARDAMPTGGTLIISADNVTLDTNDAGRYLGAKVGPYVRLHVEDNGTGILPDDLERIFDLFFTTKTVGKGTGLGLSTSLAIVKSHGGFVRVDSEPGHGTKFDVYLPARTSVVHVAQDRAVERPHGHGELVLVVEDEPSIRQITQKTLEAFGYRVIVATDGAQALAIYEQHPDEIALVLIDMMMPVMDGPTAILALRTLNPTLRIIAASGLVRSGHDATASLGVRYFLAKPYSVDALLAMLRACLDDVL
ncbi:hybrid sensor histidine kinase/response regulator [Gemmatimonas groenlandica]|uniref:histidine kinase n=1 Tax=Gemmatimonas groenlandica TaxID=2732249 RepID=A0A6M4IT99_9BACT|nr:PAS domain-containing sensor histidine kinase [Gemmatimonas groenlandica]QJR37880.1 PAS domain S-box protein [Gemmatimonas groenlandica]